MIAEHFSDILNRPAQTIIKHVEDLPYTLPIFTDKFSEKDVRKALKNNKAVVMGVISVEMMRAIGEITICGSATCAIKLGYLGTVPDDWRNCTIICITKKSNLTHSDNWMGVTLLSVSRKVYCQMILNQMCEVLDSQIFKRTGWV